METYTRVCAPYGELHRKDWGSYKDDDQHNIQVLVLSLVFMEVSVFHLHFEFTCNPLSSCP